MNERNERTKKLDCYMNDPDIANEPMPLREIHAIRLMIDDETKKMSPEERAAYTNNRTDAVMEAHGLSHLRASCAGKNKQAV